MASVSAACPAEPEGQDLGRLIFGFRIFRYAQKFEFLASGESQFISAPEYLAGRDNQGGRTAKNSADDSSLN